METELDAATPCSGCGVSYAEYAEYQDLVARSGDRAGGMDGTRLAARDRDRLLTLTPKYRAWIECDAAPHAALIPPAERRNPVDEPTAAEVTDALETAQADLSPAQAGMLAKLGLEGDLFPFFVDEDAQLVWRAGHPSLPRNASDRNDPMAVTLIRRSLDRVQIELADLLPALVETEDHGPAARWLHRVDPDLFTLAAQAMHAARVPPAETEAIAADDALGLHGDALVQHVLAKLAAAIAAGEPPVAGELANSFSPVAAVPKPRKPKAG